ncbi:hypothetical protein ACFW17_35435 [Streptomyces sp. NPDC058961]|uniref:hypothetical protein n=1 Tax=Streptomyces sp. NPDC058961 TaxID=3346680 RepID=UPI0036856E45
MMEASQSPLMAASTMGAPRAPIAAIGPAIGVNTGIRARTPATLETMPRMSPISPQGPASVSAALRAASALSHSNSAPRVEITRVNSRSISRHCNWYSAWIAIAVSIMS